MWLLPRRPWRVIGRVKTPCVFCDAAGKSRISVGCELGVPCRRADAAGLYLKIKPTTWLRQCARERTKPRGSRHNAQKCERLDFVTSKSLKEPIPDFIDIISIDAIKFKGRAAMRTRAQSVYPRDPRVQPSSGEISFEVGKVEARLPLSNVHAPWLQPLHDGAAGATEKLNAGTSPAMMR